MTSTGTATVPAFITVGARVSWSTWSGTATVTITSVQEFRVTYKSNDGTPGYWEASPWKSLAEEIASVRDLAPAAEAPCHPAARYEGHILCAH